MTANHEPRPEFVKLLEERVTAEARRQRQTPIPRARWMPQSPVWAAVTLAGIVIVSMIAGGAVVAARYQAQTQQERDMLAATYQRRMDLERQKLDIAKIQLQSVQQRVAVGTESVEASREAETQVRAAESQVRIAQSQLEEVRLTGKDPNDAVSAPLVSGRDFVRDRWNMQMEMIAASLDAAKTRLSLAQRRFDVAFISRTDLTVAESQVKETELALMAARQRLDIRQQFVSNKVDAAMADLRILEADANLRRQVAMNRMDLARIRLQELQQNLQRGLITRVDVAQAELRVSELQLEIQKADLDLTVIRQQIGQRGR